MSAAPAESGGASPGVGLDVLHGPVLGGAPAVRTWVACPRLGVSSQPWITRQLEGFARVRPQIVCWQDVREGSGAHVPGDVHVLPFVLREQRFAPRWLGRLRGAGRRNFLAAGGAEARMLRRLLARTRPAAIVCHFGHVALRLLPLAEAAGIPLIAHFHGLDVSSMLRNRWYRWSLRANLHRFAAIVVVGSHQRDWMLQQGAPVERVHLIPCGVPVKEFQCARSGRSSGLRFVAVSRLTPWKGVDFSLRAFAKVRAQAPDATLHIVGEGPQHARLEALAVELGLADAVRFVGAVPPREVRAELEAADVFVQHSLTHSDGWVEGFGVSLAEAAAMRLPVVATRSGGIVDQVVDDVTGLLVPERDVDAMATAMLQLASSPQLRLRFGDAARTRMIEHFDTQRQIARLEDVIVRSTTPAA